MGAFKYVSSAVICTHTISCFRGKIEIVLYIIKCFQWEWSEKTIEHAYPQMYMLVNQVNVLQCTLKFL